VSLVWAWLGPGLVLVCTGGPESGMRELWNEQNHHEGDRKRLYQVVAEAISERGPARSVLYPGPFVDLSPSFVFESVTYVDSDNRAEKFFAAERFVRELIDEYEGPANAEVTFLHQDYHDPLPIDDESVDLLLSLYAGFVSPPCARYLRLGGTLLVNPSHGDVAMASIDPRFRLVGVVETRDGGYRVRADDLGTYLIQKKPIELTPEVLSARGRGVAYTRSPFAYLFERTL
jgi:hypothetical protein